MILSKSLLLSSTQIKSLSFCILNKQKFLICQSETDGLKYFQLPKSVYLYKAENEYFLAIQDEKDKKFLSNFWLFMCNYYKNNSRLFTKRLILKGLGYRITKVEERGGSPLLRLKLGFSHLVDVIIPDRIKVIIKKNTMIFKSSNLLLLGNFCKRIKNLKLPNTYNGKGFWYKNEKKTLKIIKKK